jgi:AraC-like DNA-binding protein
MNGLPLITLDTTALPPGEGLERWRGCMPEYDVAAEGPPSAFAATIEACLIGDMAIAQGHVSPVRFLRTRARAATDAMDHCTIMLVLGGVLFGEIAGAPVSAGAGSVVVFDLRHPVSIRTEAFRFASLTLPRRLLAEAHGEVAEWHGLVPDGVSTRLLMDHILSLLSHLPSMTPEDVPSVARATTALIGACLARGRHPGPTPSGHGLQLAARRHIDAHLSAPLTPAAICRALRCSRSTLYRVFAPLGGIAAYIRDRRLDAACALLCDEAGPRRLAEVAERVGFVDTAGFARAFRRRFGMPPGQIRRHADLPVMEGLTARATFDRWSRSISRLEWDARP